MYNQYKEAQTLMVNNYNKINKMSNHLSSQAIEHKTDHNILLCLCFFTPLLVLKIAQSQDKYLIYFDIYKQRCLLFYCIVLFQV